MQELKCLQIFNALSIGIFEKISEFVMIAC